VRENVNIFRVTVPELFLHLLFLSFSRFSQHDALKNSEF
jgi:hypothetical protein